MTLALLVAISAYEYLTPPSQCVAYVVFGHLGLTLKYLLSSFF